MKRIKYLSFGIVILSFVLTGCAMVSVKMLSRSNLNEETIAQIIPCETTEREIVELFRAPTDDFMRKQGEYVVFIYKGFAARTELGVNTLELMINNDGIVVDTRFNKDVGQAMTDQCK